MNNNNAEQIFTDISQRAIQKGTPTTVTPKQLLDSVNKFESYFIDELVKLFPDEAIATNEWVNIVNPKSCSDIIRTEHGKIIINILDTQVTINSWDGINCTLTCENKTISQISMTPVFADFCVCLVCEQMIALTLSAIKEWLTKLGQNGAKGFYDKIAQLRIAELQKEIKKTDTLDISKDFAAIRAEMITKLSPQVRLMERPRFLMANSLLDILNTNKCLTDCTLDAKNYESMLIGNKRVPITGSKYLSEKNMVIAYDANLLLSLPNDITILQYIKPLGVSGKRRDEYCVAGENSSGVMYLVIAGKDTGIILTKKEAETSEAPTNNNSEPVIDIKAFKDELVKSLTKELEEKLTKEFSENVNIIVKNNEDTVVKKEDSVDKKTKTVKNNEDTVVKK